MYIVIFFFNSVTTSIDGGGENILHTVNLSNVAVGVLAYQENDPETVDNSAVNYDYTSSTKHNFLVYIIFQSFNNNNFIFYIFSRELVHLQSSIHTVSDSTVGKKRFSAG